MAARVKQKPRELWYQPGRGGGRAAEKVVPVPPKLRRHVLERDGYQCQRCGRSVRTQVQQYSLQHRRPGGMGGSKFKHFAANLVLVCGSGTTRCHGAIEADRVVAHDEGWLVPQGQDPALIRVLRWSATEDPEWWLLTEAGWQPAPSSAIPADSRIEASA